MLFCKSYQGNRNLEKEKERTKKSKKAAGQPFSPS
jgi:hypothetical protein